MADLARFRRILVALGVAVVVCVGWEAAVAQDQSAAREELREQIRHYSEQVRAMRDSLAAAGGDTLQTGAIESTIVQLSDAIGAITQQLAELELEVIDNRVSLRDGRGGQVTLDVPENLSEQLSTGLSSITRMFLDELPDTVHIGDMETGFTWTKGEHGLRFAPVTPKRERRVIDGGMVKITDDLAVAADEDVHGDVVAVMGDAEVAGLVRGDVVVVLGDLHLAETAEVEGKIVVILGRMDRDPGAKVADVTVVNPAGDGSRSDLSRLFRGWGALAAFQGLFLVLLMLALLLLAVVSRDRVTALVDVAEGRPGPCVGLGALALVGGHAVVLGLSALLVLTVIGIPVALLVLAALLLLDLAAIGIGAILVGRLVCRRLGWACPMPWRELIIGFILLQSLPFIASLLSVTLGSSAAVMALGWAGGALKLLSFVAGLGALLIGRFGGRQIRPASHLPPGTLLDSPPR
jgi:hypothetical protein